MSRLESAHKPYNIRIDNDGATSKRKPTKTADKLGSVRKRSCGKDDKVDTPPYKRVVYSGEKYQASASGYKPAISQDTNEQGSQVSKEKNNSQSNQRKILKAVRAKDKVSSSSKKREREDSSSEEGLSDKKLNQSNETDECDALPCGSKSGDSYGNRQSTKGKVHKKSKRLRKSRNFFSNIKASINEETFQSRYTMGSVIGHGAFGIVREATQTKDGTQVAIKIIPNHRSLSSIKTKKGAMPSEAYFLSKSQHPNVIKLIKCYKFLDSHAIVMEKPPNCKTLYDYVQTHSGQITEAEAKRIMLQIVDAVTFLEERGIMHNDLKTENVLVDGEGNVKLIDFGLAMPLTDEPISKGFIGTYTQCPPEYCERREYYGREANVWSLGCMLYDIMTGKLPFKGHIDAKYKPLRLPENFPEGAKSLINAMLNKSPVYRATLQEVGDHSWFKE